MLCEQGSRRVIHLESVLAASSIAKLQIMGGAQWWLWFWEVFHEGRVGRDSGRDGGAKRTLLGAPRADHHSDQDNILLLSS